MIMYNAVNINYYYCGINIHFKLWMQGKPLQSHY